MRCLFACVLAIGILAVASTHRPPPRSLIGSANNGATYRRLCYELANQKRSIERVMSAVSDLRNIVYELKEQVDYAG